MSHVDEGRLHEYLDALERGQEGQEDSSPSIAPHRPPSPAAKRTAQWQEIEQHLAECAECATQLEQVQLIRDRASALLRDAAPAHVSMPPFEEIQARAEARARKAPRRVFAMTRLATLGWAATIVLAVGVGWLARGSFNFGSSATEELPPQATLTMDAVAAGEVTSEAEESGRGSAADQAVTDVRGARRDVVTTAEEDVATQPASNVRLEEAAAPPPAVQRTQPADAKIDQVRQAPEREVVAGVAVAEPERRREPGVVADEAAQLPNVSVEGITTAAYADSGDEDVSRAINELFSTETWPVASKLDAERHIGRDLMAVDALPIDSIRIGEVSGQPAAAVVQQLPSGELLEIVQWKQEDTERQAEGFVAVGAVSADQAPMEQLEARAAKRTPGLITSVIAQEGFLLALRAPVSADSLAVLAARIRP